MSFPYSNPVPVSPYLFSSYSIESIPKVLPFSAIIRNRSAIFKPYTSSISSTDIHLVSKTSFHVFGSHSFASGSINMSKGSFAFILTSPSMWSSKSIRTSKYPLSAISPSEKTWLSTQSNLFASPNCMYNFVRVSAVACSPPRRGLNCTSALLEVCSANTVLTVGSIVFIVRAGLPSLSNWAMSASSHCSPL